MQCLIGQAIRADIAGIPQWKMIALRPRLEAIIDAGTNKIAGRFGIPAEGRPEAAGIAGHNLVSEVEMQILDLDAPRAGNSIFYAAAGGPAVPE
jgi:hypothetical protein